MVNHIAVFMENRRGRILELANVLKQNDIDLLSLSVSDTKEFGVLRILVRGAEAAVEILKAAGFLATAVGLVGVEVDERPGGMRDFLDVLNDAGINIEYIYSYALRVNGTIVFFKTDDGVKAEDILKEKGFKLLSEARL
jgi:hypothetical protein